MVAIQYDVTYAEYQIVYDVTSLGLACMLASTAFFWLRMPYIHRDFRSALAITGLVTFIATYHYFRIFESWVSAHGFPLPGMNTPGKPEDGYKISDPVLTGIPFNDGYRYMDWLITVPLLLIEIVLVMNLSAKETFKKSFWLGGAAATMVILGYPGEVALTPDEVNYRWIFWALAMLPFAYIVFVLIWQLRKAVNAETDPHIRRLIRAAQWGTIASWHTYPIVYMLPMLGVSGATAVTAIQVGYTISDIIAKCGVGFLIYFVTAAKSERAARNVGGALINDRERV